MGLKDIIIEIRPELKGIEDFHGKKLIEDMGFDSVDIVALISMIEEKSGIEISDIENLLDIIQEYDRLEEWFSKRM